MRAETERRVEEAYAKLLACTDHELRIAITAEVILCVFDEFYCQLCEYPYRAKRAFETMDPQASNRISTERLGLYSRFIAEHGPRILAAFPALADRFDVWDALDRLFVAMIVDRYEADTAFSFAHSLRRNICHELWRPVAYSFPPPSKLRALSMAHAHRRFPVHGRIGVDLLCEALRVPGFSVPFRDLKGDAQRILDRLRDIVPTDATEGSVPLALDVVDAGFYRDRSAFLVGRWVFAGDRRMPFVVAFLNGEDGIRADAVLHQVSDIHDLFSSTLANFHVTTRLYYQTCVFLYSLMPLRPLGHHYSTIGFNGRVFLFDYDAVEKLTDVKIRTNTDLEPGEEGVPAWFFEDGVVFLPEELEHGMQFKNDYARRCFRQVNRDLMTLEYWTRVQEMLKADELPELRVYPETAWLRDAVKAEAREPV